MVVHVVIAPSGAVCEDIWVVGAFPLAEDGWGIHNGQAERGRRLKLGVCEVAS